MKEKSKNRSIKRILSLALAVVLCTSVLMTGGLTAFASNDDTKAETLGNSTLAFAPYATAIPWDGSSVDTDWYTETELVFYISTADELAGMAKLVNEDYKDFSGKTVILLNDINLGDKEWKPIGHGHVDNNYLVIGTFAGSFNGNGYTVSGLKNEVNHAGSDAFYYFGAAGLFGFTESTAVISNLTVEGDVNVTGANNNGNLDQGNAGGIVGYNMGTVTNCVNRASVRGADASGGIAGFNQKGTIVKCVNKGAVTLTSGRSHVGGIVGTSLRGGTITFCENSGTISSTVNNLQPSIGGIVGFCSEGEFTVSNCFNRGLITTIHQNPRMGGIVGEAHNKTNIKYCYNVGEIEINHGSFNDTQTGALVGKSSPDDTPNSPSPTITKSFFLESTFSKGIGEVSSGTTVNIFSKTATAMKTPEFLDLLNDGYDYWVFVQGEDYPVLKFAQAPTVQTLTPTNTDIPLSGNIEITFDKEMRESTNGTVSINNGIGTLSGGSWTNNTSFTIPYVGLASFTTYIVTVSDFHDIGGRLMTSDNTYSFTTMLKPEPTINGTETGRTNRTVTLGYSSPETIDFFVTGSPMPSPLLKIANDDGTGATVSGARLTIPTGLAVGDYYIELESSNSAGTATHIVNFKVSALPIPDYIIMISAGTGGTATGGGTYAKNDTVTATATPNAGWSFKQWTEGSAAVSTSASYSFTVTGARSLIAEFEVDSTPPQPPTQGYSGGSSSGSSKADVSPLASRIFTKGEATKLFAAALAAKPGVQTTLSFRAQNYTGADKAAFAELAALGEKSGVTLTVHFDRVVGKAVTSRISVNPAFVTTDLDLTVKIADGKLTLPKFTVPVVVAVKMPTGITMENLKITGNGKAVTNANPWLDKNGYLHFTTTGGEIVLGK